jgi:hypothetical protein
LESDIYLIAGDYRESRRMIEALHVSSNHPDMLAPLGYLDAPTATTTASGVIPVSGWAFDNTQVTRINVLMDGVTAGEATYGLARPDIASWYVYAPVETGFSYALDTTKYSNGLHRLSVTAADDAGNFSVLAEPSITIQNTDTSAPIVSLGSVIPTANRKKLSVTVAASDNVAVTRVDLYVDGALAASDPLAPYAFVLNLFTLAKGTHQFIAKAFDAAGNVGISSAVSWTK